NTGLTGVSLSACVAVRAGRPVGLRWIGTDTGSGIAGSDVVALVGSRADDRVAARANPGLTGVSLRAGIAVRAGRPVGLRWIGADTGSRVAGSDVVALVGSRADDRAATGANTGLTGVSLRAGISVRTGGPVGLRWIGT